MNKTFEEDTTLREAIDYLRRAGVVEITKIDGLTFHFNTEKP